MPDLKKEQIEVINHEDGNILVSASAGSGKTFVMINRLIRLILEEKTSVKNVLCVTFTEAAAAEMKAKLKSAITDKIKEGVDLTEELLSVETADICTIHAFCARLIRKYFFVAEVAPDFKIADENKADIFIQESVADTFNLLYKKKDSDFLTLVKRHGKYRSDKAFKELVVKAYEFLQVDASPDDYLRETLSIYSNIDKACEKYKEYLLITLKNLREYCDDLLYRARNLAFANAEKIIVQISSDLDEVIHGDLYAFKKFTDYKISMTFGRGLPDDKALLRDEVKKLYAVVGSTFKRVNDHITDRETDEKKGLEIKEHLEKLFKVVKIFGEVYAKRKEEENLLDFADLEHFALKVLKDEETCAAIKENYRYVFADEYQDVNGVQEEILSLVSSNNLFMVGDVKQSIYGFRGCRPEIFEEKEKRMRETGQKTVRLNHNFRSAESVLNTVNEIFSYSMTEKLYGTSYRKTAMLVGGGIYPETQKGRTCLHLLETEKAEEEKKTPKVYNLFEEAKKTKSDYPSNIALLIEKIIREELGKKYYDTKEKEEKTITFSNIVILNKNKDNDYVFSLVSDLLRLNIPVASEVTEEVLVYPEIQLLISVLKLIDCKAEDIPLVSVMKSPVGNFTEIELMKIALLYKDYTSGLDNSQEYKRNFFSAYKYAIDNMQDELGDKVRAFDKYIDEIRVQADFFGAGKILEKVILDSGLENYLLTKGGAEEKFKRISFFLKKAVEEKIYTVHEFLNLINKSPKAFALTPSAGSDAVRMMTIHASKGLEFPVVIVCGLEKGVNHRPQTEEVLKDYQLGFCLKNYDDENKKLEQNLYRGLFREKMRVEKIKEDLRLFYVATTRASYSMHLTFEAKSDIRRDFFIGADKFIDYVPKYVEVEEVDPKTLSKKMEERKGKRKVLVGKGNMDLTEKIKKDLSFSYPYENATTLPIKTSVTKVNLSGAEEENIPILISDEDGEFETGAERGTIAHKILELADFELINEGGKLRLQVDSMVEKGYLKKEEAEMVDLQKLENAVGLFAGRVKGKTLYREQPFLASIDGEKVIDGAEEKILVQGVIDLLAISDEGAEIIDYKYSILAGESLKRKYQKQLELYALAVEKVLKTKVIRKTLVNLLSGECVDF